MAEAETVVVAAGVRAAAEVVVADVAGAVEGTVVAEAAIVVDAAEAAEEDTNFLPRIYTEEQKATTRVVAFCSPITI
jgi:hypothetical protein